MDLLAKLNKKITRLQYISKIWNVTLRPIVESMINDECNEVKKFRLEHREGCDYFYLYITAIAEDCMDSHTERIGFIIKDIKENGFDSPSDFVDFLSDELNDSLKEDNKEENSELFPGMNEMMEDLTIRK